MEKYSKIRHIGKGNMGNCVLVKNSEDGRQYVMKQIDLGAMNKKERRQALNEAKVLSSLRHPNIINYADSFLARRSDHLCIVMEHADAGDIAGRLKACRGNLRENVIIDWFIQTALALNAMHHKRILHRDVKTQNIFLTSQGIVKLGDFGIARELTNTFDQAHTFVGTPYYLSPELVQEKPYDMRSDTWALGVVLYEMMALRHPFNANDMKSLMTKIIRVSYDPPPSVYSQELRDLVHRILVKDVRQRISLSAILNLPVIRRRISQWVSGMAGVPQPYLDAMLQHRLLPEYAVLERKVSAHAKEEQRAEAPPRVEAVVPERQTPKNGTTTEDSRDRRDLDDINQPSPAERREERGGGGGGGSHAVPPIAEGKQPYNVNYPHSLPNVPYPHKPPLLSNMNLNQYMGKKQTAPQQMASATPGAPDHAKVPSSYIPSPKSRENDSVPDSLRARELMKERELQGMMGQIRGNPHLARLPAKGNHSQSPIMGEPGALPRIPVPNRPPMLQPHTRLPQDNKGFKPHSHFAGGAPSSNYQVPPLPHAQKRTVLPLPPVPPVSGLKS